MIQALCPATALIFPGKEIYLKLSSAKILFSLPRFKLVTNL